MKCDRGSKQLCSDSCLTLAQQIRVKKQGGVSELTLIMFSMIILCFLCNKVSKLSLYAFESSRSRLLLLSCACNKSAILDYPIYTNTFILLFTGKSECNTQDCQRTFKDLSSEIIQFKIPSVQTLKDHEHVLRHCETSQKAKKAKSQFVPPYDNPHTQHQVITHSTKEVRNHTKTAEKFLEHSVHIDTSSSRYNFRLTYETGDKTTTGTFVTYDNVEHYMRRIDILFDATGFRTMFPGGLVYSDEDTTKSEGTYEEVHNKAEARTRHTNKAEEKLDALAEKNKTNRAESLAKWRKEREEIESGSVQKPPSDYAFENQKERLREPECKGAGKSTRKRKAASTPEGYRAAPKKRLDIDKS